MSDDNGAPITVTLKGGTGHDVPWVVVRADTPDQAVQRLDAVGQNGVLAKAAQVAAEFQGVYAAAAGLGATPVQVQGAPQAQAAQWQAQAAAPQAAPSGPVPMCQHGPRVHKSGEKNGRRWEAWMCARPRGSADACPPEWA